MSFYFKFDKTTKVKEKRYEKDYFYDIGMYFDGING